MITVGNLYYLTFCYSVKKSFADHGGVNRIPFLALIAIFNLLYLIVSTVLYFMRRMRRLTIAVVAVLTVTTALYIYYGRIKDSCVGWEYGLAGKKIENEGGVCRIETPQTCTYVQWAGVLDVYK